MRSPFAFVALAVLPLLACGGGAQELSSFQLVRDGAAIAVDHVTSAAVHLDTGTVELTFSPEAGCGAAIDGCTSYVLTVDLDAKAIAANVPNEVAGTTTYDINPTKGLYPSSFVPSASNSPVVKGIGLLSGCDPCSPPGSYTEADTGTVTLTSSTAGQIAGTLHLKFSGGIPNEVDASQTITIDATFDLAVK